MAQKQYYDENGKLTTKQGWEEEKFIAAKYFTVCIMLGGGKKDVVEVQHYLQALAIAVAANLRDERAMIYAVTSVGSPICIPRDKYQHYLDIYNESAGTKYRFPPLDTLLQKLNPKTRG